MAFHFTHFADATTPHAFALYFISNNFMFMFKGFAKQGFRTHKNDRQNYT